MNNNELYLRTLTQIVKSKAREEWTQEKEDAAWNKSWREMLLLDRKLKKQREREDKELEELEKPLIV